MPPPPSQPPSNIPSKLPQDTGDTSANTRCLVSPTTRSPADSPTTTTTQIHRKHSPSHHNCRQIHCKHSAAQPSPVQLSPRPPRTAFTSTQPWPSLPFPSLPRPLSALLVHVCCCVAASKQVVPARKCRGRSSICRVSNCVAISKQMVPGEISI